MRLPPRLFLSLLALSSLLFPARAQVVSPAPAPLAVVADDSAWQVIPQHPLDPTKPPAADDPRWMPLGTYRGRAHQLANPREPGLGLWLQTRVDLKTPPAAGDSVVVALANALIADAAFLNGTELPNETFASNRPFPSDDQVLFPTNQSPKAAFFARWDDPKNSWWTREALLGRDFGAIRRPMSALFSAPASAVKAGRNTLQLAIYEQEVNTMLPGPVELRRARLDDRVQLNSFTRTAGDNATETILLVQQSLPGADPVALSIEMQDDVGLLLWTETPALDFTKGKLQQAIPIKARSLQDYKAVVRATAPGQPVVEHWAYTHQGHTQPSAQRDEFKITTTNWEYRPISQDEKVVLPPPTDAWKRGKQGTGAADGYKRRYYFRTTFTAPAELAKGRALLAIGELRMKGDFFLNGQEIGTRRYYDAPFELDISGVVKPGQSNELIVVLHDGMTPEFLTDGTPPVADGQKEPPVLTSRFHYDRLDQVRLNHLSVRRVPSDVRVLRNRIVTSVKARTLTVTSTLENTSAAPLTATPTFTVKDRTGKVLSFAGQPITVPAKSTVEATTTRPWADAKLWSPDSPYLYALETTLSDGKTLLDATRDRFGFREIEVVGKNFLLNGEIIRFRTLAPGILLRKGNNQDEPDFYKYNTNIAALRASKEVGFNAFRIRDANTIRAYYAACDEIGLATGILSDLVDNLNQRIAFTDPITWENSYQELVSSHRGLGNHASALWYDLGNENIAFDGPSSAPKVADFLYRNEQRIRAYDPTRFVFSSGAEGGYDGRAQVYSPHYPWTGSQRGAFVPTQWWYLTTRYQDIPASLRERTLWPEFDPQNRYKGMAKFPGGAWADVPIFNDEYAWLQDWSFAKIDGNGQPWAGERVFKPFSPRVPNDFRRQMWNGANYRNYGIGDHLTFLERIEMETQAYRGVGLAGLQRWDNEYRLPEGPHMPVVAFLREHVRSYFGDTPVTRTLYAVNDTEMPQNLDLQVRIHRLAADGARTLVQTEKFGPTLQPGEIVQRGLTIPAQKVTTPTTFLAEVVRIDAGAKRVLHRQQWTLFPRAWAGSVAKDARIAVYDPKGSIQGLFESLGTKAQLLANPADIDKSNARLLVIGEDADAEELSNATSQLASFLRGGGTLFALRQPAGAGITDWLPVKLNNDIIRSFGVRQFAGSSTSLGARHHPLFAGLLPADLSYWAPQGLVFGTGYILTNPLPNTRILAGLAPFNAQLLEGTLGQGRWFATTLELTPEIVQVAPPAARILVNLINLAHTPPAAPPPTAPAVVYSPGNDTPLATALRDKLKLIATFTTTEPKLSPGQALFLTDWKTITPPVAFAARVRPWLQAGGTLVVQSGGTDLAPWLEKATGLKVAAQPALDNSQGSKLVVHPLLDGIFEGDLQWDQKPSKFDQPGTFADLLLRVEGATELLDPAALSVATVGQGRLIIDQTRWSEAKQTPRGQRFQRTLLTNLGLRVQAPDYGSRRERFTVPAKLTFAPLPLGQAPTLHAASSGVDLSGIKTPFRIANVPFRPLAAGKNLVALASGAAYPSTIRQQLGPLPAESNPIPLGRTAKHLFFAHTGFYHAAAEGDDVLTYVVRYVGHERVIGGQDAGDLIQEIPVRAGLDLADWNGVKGVTPPANAAAFQTKDGNAALVFVQRWDNPFPDRVIDSIVIRSVPTAKTQPYVLGVTAAWPE